MKKTKITTTIVCILILSICTVYASIGTRTASLTYDNIKIILDGKEVVPTDSEGNAVEPFIIDGTTYLPVRGISNALGLEVGWNGETKTVELNTPGVFSGAVQVYDDKYVTIEFAGCTVEKPYEFSDTIYYYANFNIKNKTDAELTFQTDALSFNGISYNDFMGSESVAAKSTGKIHFYTETVIPVSGISKTSGTIKVIDWDESVFGEYTYDAKWVDVTQK